MIRTKRNSIYNLRTTKSFMFGLLVYVKDFSIKLGTLVNHDETMYHA